MREEMAQEYIGSAAGSVPHKSTLTPCPKSEATRWFGNLGRRPYFARVIKAGRGRRGEGGGGGQGYESVETENWRSFSNTHIDHHNYEMFRQYQYHPRVDSNLPSDLPRSL